MKLGLNTSFVKDYWELFSAWIFNQAPGILLILILFIISLKLGKVLVTKLSKFFLSRAEKMKGTDATEAKKRVETLIAIVWGATKLVIWSVFLMILLKKMGMDIAPILASAGIIGLAVGFGAQELVRDFISGFFILLENQVRIGDVAIINGTGGLVEKIELRTITLRDLSGVVHIFQNGKVDTLSNMTKEWSAMVFEIGVAYKEDYEKVTLLMKQVADEMQQDDHWSKLIIEPIEILGLDQFADSAVIIKARIKTKPIEQWNVGREYRKRLKMAFDANNVEIPFPHTTVYWGEEIKPLNLNLLKNER